MEEGETWTRTQKCIGDTQGPDRASVYAELRVQHHIHVKNM
jgi:hypothetical protein